MEIKLYKNNLKNIKYKIYKFLKIYSLIFLFASSRKFNFHLLT